MKQKCDRPPVPELVCLCIQAGLSACIECKQAGGAEGKGG
jgi:hypothetical protein